METLHEEREYRLSTGRALYYQEAGTKEGYPTLLIHGALGTGDFSSYQDLFEELNVRAISPTLPGWGRSDPVQDRNLLLWAEDVRELMDALEIAEFDVCGISLGGPHALACAIGLPARVRKTLVINGHAPLEEDPLENFDPFVDMNAPSRLGLSFFSSKVSFLGKLAAWYVKGRTEDPVSGQSFVQEALLSQLNEAERQQLEDLPQPRKDSFVGDLVSGMHRSLSHHYTGYVELPSLLRSWSRHDIQQIPHQGKFVMLIGSSMDVIVPPHHQLYLSRLLPAAHISIVEGGHLTSVLQFPERFRDFHSWQPFLTDDSLSASSS